MKNFVLSSPFCTKITRNGPEKGFKTRFKIMFHVLCWQYNKFIYFCVNTSLDLHFYLCQFLVSLQLRRNWQRSSMDKWASLLHEVRGYSSGSAIDKTPYDLRPKYAFPSARPFPSSLYWYRVVTCWLMLLLAVSAQYTATCQQFVHSAIGDILMIGL